MTSGFSRRWLPLLPILALVTLFLYFLFVNPQRSSNPVGEFVLPSRMSGRPVQELYRLEVIASEAGWTPELLRLAGDLWREAGDVTRALPYWHAADAGEDQTLLRDIALAELETQDWASAGDTLRRLAVLAPDDAWVHFQLGLIEAVVNPDSAAQHLAVAARENAYAVFAARVTRLLPASADDPAAMIAIGQAYADHELWALAELAFTQAASSTQSIPEALAYAGLARSMQGKDGGQMIERALQLAPGSPTVRLLQGLHLRQIGDYGGSLRALIDAVALDPENPVLYAELGAAYHLNGDLELAWRWLEQALALSNGDARYQQMLDMLSADEAVFQETLELLTEATEDATAESAP